MYPPIEKFRILWGRTGQYLTHHELPDWIVVLNVDVRLKNAAIFEQLRSMKNISNLGVVAPATYRDRPREDQNPHLRKRPYMKGEKP